jgi:hypothetical protein
MKLRRVIPLVVLPLLLAGCAGYRLGPSNGLEAGARSIQILPPQNETLEPRVSDAFSHALRKQIQRDGTFRLRTSGEGDVVVTTTITRYHRQGLTFQRGDTLTVRDYNIQLFARVRAFDRVTGRNIVNREFHGRTTVRVGNDQSSAERQALPLLAEQLAHTVASAIADGEW